MTDSEIEFTLEYARKHPQLSGRDLIHAIQVAWQRLDYKWCAGDEYQWWMQDTRLMLDMKRAMRIVSLA